MKYVNPQQNTIDAGPDWQALGFQGQYFPVCPGNSDYDSIVREGLLDQVLPWEAPAEITPEPSRAEKLEALLVAKGIFTKDELDGLLGA